MSFTANQIADFEQSFQAYIRELRPGYSLLNQAMQYSLLNGGKRLRPRFAIESAQLVDLHPQATLACAFALEIVHGFSLVHDDLPALDNDDFRRGNPTTHRQFNEPIALLAGDALHGFAYQTFLKAAPWTEACSFYRSMDFFMNSVEGMILGQTEELGMDQNNLNELMKVQSLKTGKLFEAAILCPLLLAGKTSSDSIFQECQKFAIDFGFAFQIADDLEDLAQDQAQGTKNILTHLGRDAAIRLAVESLQKNTISSHFTASALLLAKLK